MGCLCWLSAFLAPAAACLAFYLAAPCLPPGALESVAALIVLQGVCWAARAVLRGGPREPGALGAQRGGRLLPFGGRPVNVARAVLRCVLHAAPVGYLMLAVSVAGCAADPRLLALFSVGTVAVHFGCVEVYGRLREEEGRLLEMAAWKADTRHWRRSGPPARVPPPLPGREGVNGG